MGSNANTINDWSIMAHPTTAYEIGIGDNIYWFGILYMVTDIVHDYEDGTVLFKVGYPRRIEDNNPILTSITTQLSKLIDVM